MAYCVQSPLMGHTFGHNMVPASDMQFVTYKKHSSNPSNAWSNSGWRRRLFQIITYLPPKTMVLSGTIMLSWIVLSCWWRFVVAAPSDLLSHHPCSTISSSLCNVWMVRGIENTNWIIWWSKTTSSPKRGVTTHNNQLWFDGNMAHVGDRKHRYKHHKTITGEKMANIHWLSIKEPQSMGTMQ